MTGETSARTARTASPSASRRRSAPSAAQPFRYSYNGSSYQITGVSFAGKTCVGLFGYNTGTLSNIIITTDVPMNNADGSVNSKAPTAKVTSTVQLNTVYVGVLAGWNQTGGAHLQLRRFRL